MKQNNKNLHLFIKYLYLFDTIDFCVIITKVKLVQTDCELNWHIAKILEGIKQCKLENVLRQAIKKWSSTFYFQKFKTTNDRFQGGGGGKLPNANCDYQTTK